MGLQKDIDLFSALISEVTGAVLTPAEAHAAYYLLYIGESLQVVASGRNVSQRAIEKLLGQIFKKTGAGTSRELQAVLLRHAIAAKQPKEVSRAA